MFRLALLALLPGCLVGGGPVLAVRAKSKIALGWETSANLFAVGVEGGKTYALDDGPTAGYGAFRYNVPLYPSEREADALLIGLDPETAPHLNLMVGYGGRDGRNGFTAGAAPMVVLGKRDCFSENYLVSIAVGVRTVGGMTEVYVAPKANFHVPAPCD